MEQSISCLNTILLWRVHLQDTSAESGRFIIRAFCYELCFLSLTLALFSIE